MQTLLPPPAQGQRSHRRWHLLSATFFMFVLMTGLAFGQDYSIKFETPNPDEEVREYKPGETVQFVFYIESPKALEEVGNYIMLSVSSDGGKSWNDISDRWKAQDRYDYEWQIPDEYAGYELQFRAYEYCDRKECKYAHQDGYSGYIKVIGEGGGCNPITINNRLEDQEVCSGSYVYFQVDADVKEATYEWYKNDQLISVSRENYLQVYAGSKDAQGRYYARVVVDCGEQAYSNGAQLRIRETVYIATQPVPSVTLCEGGATEFSVRADGEVVGYQWRKDGFDIPGETSNVLRIPNALPHTAGVYDVIVFGTCKPEAISEPATLNVNTLPKLTLNPEPLFLCNGASGSISVAATGGNLKYQWFRNGEPVVDGNNPTLNFTSFDPSMSGDYQCVVTPATIVSAECDGTLYSRTVRVSSFIAPVITRQPASTDGCIGSSVTLVAGVDGLGLTYRWMKNGITIPNSNSNALTLNNLTDADAGAYSVMVMGTCGLSASSNAATVTIIEKPVVLNSASDKTLNIGESFDLTVSGTDVRSIQWLRNSQPIPGATSATYAVTNATLADNGVYNAILTNSCGKVLTQYARVRVKDPSALLPELTLTQNAADLGEIPVGYDKDVTLTGVITNTGNANMVVESVVVNGSNYSVVSERATPFTLAPGESSTVTATATATAVGPIAATLTVTTNAPMPSDEIALTAMGVLRYAVPALIDYALVAPSTTKELCVDLTNTSGVEIVIDNFNVSGTDAAMFTVATQPFTLAAGATQQVCVTYTAAAQEASHTAMLNVVSSTGGNTAVALQGTTDKPSSVDDEVLAMGMSAYPNPSTDIVTINTGSATVSSVDIVDGTGRRITSLDVTAPTLVWNGRDASGAPAANGIYTAVVRTVNATASLPLVIIR